MLKLLAIALVITSPAMAKSHTPEHAPKPTAAYCETIADNTYMAYSTVGANEAISAGIGYALGNLLEHSYAYDQCMAQKG